MVELTDEQLKSFVGACSDEGGKAFAQRLNVQVKELTAEKFEKKRQATDPAEVETVALEVSKRPKMSPRGPDTRFEQPIKYAGDWEFTMAVDYPEVTEGAPMLVGMVARDPSLDYHTGVQKIIHTMNQWENLGYRCQGKVVDHRIALAVLSCEYANMVVVSLDFGKSLMKEPTFEKHLKTLQNCVVLDRLENDSVRDHLDEITTYAKACHELLPPKKRSE
ncbi:hypothetical protein [Absidia glauca]|uniref:Uncharacterized protein n=1 Tax=Absidia glauca TaxID=4829 RepID=A0A163JDC5_ABSGL|nr:hypothetical protein [Absidia glauca]